MGRELDGLAGPLTRKFERNCCFNGARGKQDGIERFLCSVFFALPVERNGVLKE
jgi:hypothetical protein